MKVVQVGKYYPPVPGGIENNVCALAEGLSEHVDVQVLVLGTERTTVHDVRNGVPVVRVGTRGKVWSTEMAPGFFGHLSRIDADIIHLHMPNPVSELAYLTARARGRLRNAKLIITYHAEPPWKVFQLYHPIVRKMLRSADRVVTYTKKYWDGTPILRDFDDKQSIIPHGISPDIYRETDQIRQTAAEIRTAHGPRILLCVGRLVYYKGLPTLLDAMQQVDAKLLIAGTGPLEGTLRQQIQEKNLQSKVELLGRVDEATKIALYHACDVFTLPACDRAEAFGQVILEAQACRKPVVTTDLESGVSELNQHNYTGITIPVGDVNALAEALQSLLLDEKRARQFGEVAYQRFLRRFTRDAMIRRTLDLYRDVLTTPERAVEPEAVPVATEQSELQTDLQHEEAEAAEPTLESPQSARSEGI